MDSQIDESTKAAKSLIGRDGTSLKPGIKVAKERLTEMAIADSILSGRESKGFPAVREQRSIGLLHGDKLQAKDRGREDHAAELMRFGLTKLQAKIYVTLLQLGPSPAKTLTKVCGIHRVESYRILGELRGLGLVEEILAKPTRFLAISPSKAVSMLVSGLRETVNGLDLSKNRIIDSLNSIERELPQQPSEEDVRFRVLRGDRQACEMQSEAFNSAMSEILFITSDLGKMTTSNYSQLLKRCSERGVRARLLVPINPDTAKLAKTLSKYATIRHVDTVPVHITIVDGRQLLLGPPSREHERRSDSRLVAHLWTNSEDCSRIMQDVYERFWSESVDYRTRLRQIKTGRDIGEGLRRIVEKDYAAPHSSARQTACLTRRNELELYQELPGIRIFQTARCPGARLQTTINFLDPDADTGPSFHHGEETTIVMEGKILLQVEQHDYVLSKHDSLTYNSGSPHRWVNIGKRIAAVYSVNYPATF